MDRGRGRTRARRRASAHPRHTRARGGRRTRSRSRRSAASAPGLPPGSPDDPSPADANTGAVSRIANRITAVVALLVPILAIGAFLLVRARDDSAEKSRAAVAGTAPLAPPRLPEDARRRRQAVQELRGRTGRRGDLADDFAISCNTAFVSPSPTGRAGRRPTPGSSPTGATSRSPSWSRG